jgi:hypothetical protein
MELPASMPRDPETLMMWMESKQAAHDGFWRHIEALEERKKPVVTAVFARRRVRRDVIERGFFLSGAHLPAASRG